MMELNILKRKVTLFVIAIAILVNQGCTTRLSHVTPEVRNQFANGQIVLDCQLACHFSWISSFPKLTNLYANGQWQQLADEVIRIGFLNDLSYFYLGRAAEGLGYYQTALIYYRNSAKAFENGQFRSVLRCKLPSRDECNGINLPHEQIAHQMAVQNKLTNAMQTRMPLQENRDNEKPINVKIRGKNSVKVKDKKKKQIPNTKTSSNQSAPKTLPDIKKALTDIKTSDSKAVGKTDNSDFETPSPALDNNGWEIPAPVSR
jgi:hypothetical protein